jgi:uncharacterized protein YxjI
MPRERDVIRGVDLTGNQYTTKQRFIRNKYKVYDAQGNHILSTKQKLFKMKEEFPVTDPNGNELFEIQAQNILDVAGDYTVAEAGSGNPIVVLEKKWTLLTHKWKVRDPNDERLLAKIESRGAFVALLRNIPYLNIVTHMIPHKYTIEDADGRQIGSIEGRFSIRDTYDIQIADVEGLPKEAIVAAAIAVDALEGN